MSISPESSVGDLVGERLGRLEIFERHGIDYCCGGKTTLVDACRAAGCDPRVVIEALVESDRAANTDRDADTTDWRAVSLAALTDHIVARHHAYLVQELPRVGELVDKVLAAHGANHAELAEVASVFAALRAELEAHLQKEERVLFPMIQEMEITREAGRAHCGSVNNPIGVMEHEHVSAGASLARLRQLTSDYTPPADACPTYLGLMAGLAALERDLHEHIHKENNILHPRAAELEAALLSGVDGAR